MSRAAFAVCLALAGPAVAADPDPLADVAARLRAPVDLDVQGLKLDDWLTTQIAPHGVQVVLNLRAFRAAGMESVAEYKAAHPLKLKGVRLEQALRLGLEAYSTDPALVGDGSGRPPLAYLVRRGYVEVVPASALEPLYTPPQFDDGRDRVAAVPLATAVVKNVSLVNAVDDLADAYEQTVTFSEGTSDAAARGVTARLQNVPFDTALELLAAQAGLRVARKDRAYRLVTPAELRNEVELENLRNGVGVGP